MDDRLGFFMLHVINSFATVYQKRIAETSQQKGEIMEEENLVAKYFDESDTLWLLLMILGFRGNESDKQQHGQGNKR